MTNFSTELTARHSAAIPVAESEQVNAMLTQYLRSIGAV